MTSMFVTLGSWNWLILGLVLIGVEVLAPGVFMLWLGLAALLVGLLSFVIDMDWQMQVLLFAIFAAAAVPIWRSLARRGKSETSNPFLNRRNDALVGRVFTLEKPIQDGSGTVRIDDTIWRVTGPDAPAGSRIRIVKADGATLTVAAE
ncbi:MAG: NfeD family protein [Rhizobiales bacterium]|nr:NfeD family protein [Hyphomicrobiales bacterium]